MIDIVHYCIRALTLLPYIMVNAAFVGHLRGDIVSQVQLAGLGDVEILN